MALNKSLPVGTTGFTAEYWKIGNVAEDFRSAQCTTSLLGYANKDVRETEGSEPVSSRNLIFTGEEYQPEMTRAQIYDAIKARTDGDFVGATDNM